jgi:nucleoid-associated protein YgaU
MAYKCYIGTEEMPITPANLDVKIKGANKTVTLLNQGEVNFLRTPGLTQISVPFVLPTLTGKGAAYYLAMFEKLKSEKQTTIFMLTRTTPDGRLLFDTNFKVSIEDYSIQEDATKGLDVTVSVEMKQWRDYGTKVITVTQTAPAHVAAPTTSSGGGGGGSSTPTSSGSSTASSTIIAGDKVIIKDPAYYGGLSSDRGKKVPTQYTGKVYTVTKVQTNKGEPEALIKELYSWVALKYLQKQGASTTTTTSRDASSAPKTKTYTVVKGDTLWGIAKKYYGDGSQYTKIFNANKNRISNPNVIQVGWVLTIP